MKNSHSESYAAAGVDVTAGYEAVERIKPMVESTYIRGDGYLGGFGGMFAPDLSGIKKPVLVSGTDGVGTKLKLAFLMDKHDTWASTAWPCASTTSSAGAPLHVLPGLHRLRQEPPRPHRGHRLRHHRGLPPGGVRPGGRRDRRDARLLPRGGVRLGRLLRGHRG